MPINPRDLDDNRRRAWAEGERRARIANRRDLLRMIACVAVVVLIVALARNL